MTHDPRAGRWAASAVMRSPARGLGSRTSDRFGLRPPVWWPSRGPVSPPERRARISAAACVIASSVHPRRKVGIGGAVRRGCCGGSASFR